MKNSRQLILLAAILFVSFAAGATQGKSKPGQLEGCVKDAVTKKPVSGVIVSASSQGVNNAKETITDADGFYRFSELPFSQVSLQFGKKGYQLYKRDHVEIREKTTVEINVEFLRQDINTVPGSDSEDSEYPLLRMLEM